MSKKLVFSNGFWQGKTDKHAQKRLLEQRNKSRTKFAMKGWRGAKRG